MNITIKIPFLPWTSKAPISIEIDASIEARFHLRAAVIKAAEQRADLQGANLRYANLQGADLQGANLQGANLRYADLQGADLQGANLRYANLQRADLQRADLQRADLQGADLRYANLQGADLQRADLQRANLQGADLQGANLQGANLRYANLQGADLQGANLRYANLQGANLRYANLQGAKNSELALAMTVMVPEGGIGGWKKCRNGVIVHLLIPHDAKRSSASGRKCRAEFAQVMAVFGAEHGVSSYDGKTIYRVGETVRCDSWCEDRWQECAGGIHFFLTRLEAENYN